MVHLLQYCVLRYILVAFKTHKGNVFTTHNQNWQLTYDYQVKLSLNSMLAKIGVRISLPNIVSLLYYDTMQDQGSNATLWRVATVGINLMRVDYFTITQAVH